MERAVVLTQGGGQPQASPALGDLVAQYSSILASQVWILLGLYTYSYYQACTVCTGVYPYHRCKVRLGCTWTPCRKRC